MEASVKIRAKIPILLSVMNSRDITDTNNQVNVNGEAIICLESYKCWWSSSHKVRT